MAPMDFEGSAADVVAAVEAVVGSASGAAITKRSSDRVEAVFTSRIFRFKDDVTFVVDEGSKQLHFRSASRTGHSDLGANRKRMAALIPQIKAKL